MLSKSFGAQVTRGAAILKTLRAFRKDESGASLVIVGLTLPVLIGAMGLAAEVSYWQLHHRAMQNAADAAVIAAATNNKVTPANVIGSVAVTPKSSDDTIFVSANDPPIPIATPTKMVRIP